jgi:ribosomal-protein-alanine N-acetyltransferase
MLHVQFDAFPEIETDRLRMREIVPADAATLFALRTDPQVTQYLDRENDKDVEVVKTLIGRIRDSFDAGDGITWGLSLLNDPKLIGTMGIWKIDKTNHRGEVGYTLFPQFWGKGLMSEAMEATIAFGFQYIGLHSLEANTSVGNNASHALLRKFGFVQEAHFKENWYFQGKFLDSVIFSLLNPKR